MIENNLKSILQSRGITQVDLAKQLNCSPQQISKYVNNENSLSLEDSVSICNFFGISMEELYPASLIPAGKVTNNITTINHYGFWSFIGRLTKTGDLQISSNNIAMLFIIVGLVAVFTISMIKLLPFNNTALNMHFLSYQYTVMCTVVTAMISLMIRVSFLTYFSSFITIACWLFSLNNVLSSPFVLTPNSRRLVIYGSTLILTYLYVEFLKSRKLKANTTNKKVFKQSRV